MAGSRTDSENAEKGAETEGARTVGRVLKLLELISGAQRPLRLVDITAALDMPTSSAHVLLQQLVKYDYIRTTEDRRYTQSSGLVVLASRAMAGTRLIHIARPRIERLSADTGESVYLGIRTAQGIVYIDSIEATYGLVSRTPIGSPRPLHASSAGRVFLAFAVPEADLDALLGPDPLVAFTPRTPVDRADLGRILQQIRKDGFAVNEQALMDKVYGVSAAIFDANSKLMGTVTLSAPDTRFIPKRDLLIGQVKAAAADISRGAGLDDWEQALAGFA
jgi:DNA-binding IclR family transcriptional regulator